MIKILLTLLISLFSVSMIFAEEDKEYSAIENDEPQNKEKWESKLKSEHNLTDEQIKTMQSKNMSYPQMAIAANMSKKSGKSLDEVIQMRTEQKMGWGKIAKELEIHPKEIGQSMKDSKMQHKNEMRAMRKDKRMELKEQKREKRKERKSMMKGESGSGHGKGK